MSDEGVNSMFINKASDGLNNICGKNIASARKARKLSQHELADGLQLLGLEIDKNAIQRIECGKRFITDIELTAFSRFFEMPYSELLETQLCTHLK